MMKTLIDFLLINERASAVSRNSLSSRLRKDEPVSTAVYRKSINQQGKGLLKTKPPFERHDADVSVVIADS